MQSVEYRGRWWRPSNPAIRIPGVLTFQAGQRPRLDLLGSFFDQEETLRLAVGFHSEPVLLGESPTGHRITLIDCTGELGDSTLDFLTTNYDAEFLLVGQHFERKEAVAFPAIEVSFTNLQDWTLIHGFKSAPQTAKGVDIRYEPPADRTARVAGLDITLAHRFAWQEQGVGERRIVQSTLLRVAAPQPCPLRELLNGPVVTLRSLVALATGVPVYPVLLEAYCSNPPNPKEVIQVFCNTGPVEEPRQLAQTDMLFVFGDIADRFAEVLQRWFNDQEVIGPTVDLYVGTLYGQRMYLHHEFLSLAQSLESLHQRVAGSEALMCPHAFELLRWELSAAIPRHFPAAIAKTLEEKFGYMNEFTLADKLAALLADAPLTIRQRVIPNADAFANSVRWTRNFYTHYKEEDRAKAAQGVALVNLTDQMRWLLAGLLLQRLGLPAEQVEAILQRNGSLRRAAHWH